MDVRQTQVEERASPRRRADTGPIHAKRFDADARGPLAGVRVVDLSRLMAGNMLSLQLADFGADVVKVENERGDTLRAVGAGGVSTNWKVYGRNKRSVCVDLRSADGIDIVKRLVRDADVFVESFKPGVLEQMGLGPDVLLELRPSLVIARISGWGQTGPYRHKPGFGTLAEGYAGFASINGFADREPVLPPMFLGDMTAGLSGAIAVGGAARVPRRRARAGDRRLAVRAAVLDSRAGRRELRADGAREGAHRQPLVEHRAAQRIPHARRQMAMPVELDAGHGGAAVSRDRPRGPDRRSVV